MDLKALLCGRCPRCRKGPVFKPGLLGLLGLTNDECPVCGLPFLRESGYFTGAMYVSYFLGVATVLPVASVLAVVAQWPLGVVMAIALIQILVSMPLFFRFSRLIWLHLDQALDPR